jgi:hypothetical protein
MSDARVIKMKTTFPIAFVHESTGLNETTITIMTREEARKLNTPPYPNYVSESDIMTFVSTSIPDVSFLDDAIASLTDIRKKILAVTKIKGASEDGTRDQE